MLFLAVHLWWFVNTSTGSEYRGESGRQRIRICCRRAWGPFWSAPAATTKPHRGRQQWPFPSRSLEAAGPDHGARRIGSPEDSPLDWQTSVPLCTHTPGISVFVSS